MGKSPDVLEVLDMAITREHDAAEFYRGLAHKAPGIEMKRVFDEFAAEEQKHESILKEIRAGKRGLLPGKPVVDLKIAETTRDVTPGGHLDYAGALLLAMKREKESFRLYHGLAEITEGEVSATFRALAQEEAKHKLRFEVAYEDDVMPEN